MAMPNSKYLRVEVLAHTFLKKDDETCDEDKRIDSYIMV